MLDYSEGSKHCRTNSRRLSTSARILLKDSDGTDSFGLFLYYIAYEEMAKAVFCLFVERGWVNPEFIKPVFADHKAKIFLFDEIFRSFEMKDNYAFLGGERLGQKSLEEFMKNYESSNKQHRKTTNDFLYVNKGNLWKTPSVIIPTKKKDEEQIEEKIKTLESIFDMIENKWDAHYSEIKNFKIIENRDGKFTIQFDTP